MSNKMPCSISDGPPEPEENWEFVSIADDIDKVRRSFWRDRIEGFTQPLDEGKIDPAMRENPKLIRAMKDGKAPLEYLVLSVLEGDARVHKSGADKYGIRNWLIDRIKASTYIAAILRHLIAWALGQDLDPDSGESHLLHIRACCAILLDSADHGTLTDDRLLSESKDQE